MPVRCTFCAELALALEESRQVRELLRERGALLAWERPEVQGTPTLAAIAANARVMVVFADVFCPAMGKVKAPPIAWVRAEALWLHDW